MTAQSAGLTIYWRRQNTVPTMSYLLLILVITSTLAVLFILVALHRLLGLWIRCFTSGASLPVVRLIGMTLRQVNASRVTRAHVTASQAELDVSVDELETHELAGGDALSVTRATVQAQAHDMDVTWQQLAAIDLAGYDVERAVELAIEQNLQPDELDPAFLRRINAPRRRDASDDRS